MKPAQREMLYAAASLVAARLAAGVEPAALIAELVASHGAVHRTWRDPHLLRFGGVTSTCTSSAAGALLGNWRTAATLKLMQGPMS